MEITYYGHSCFMFDTGSLKILVDPFITANSLAGHIDVSLLKPDYILVSHGHADHVLDVTRIYQQSNAHIVANFEVATWFQNKQLDRIIPMNQGGTLALDTVSITLTHALHSSSLPDGSYGGNPVGFIIESSDSTLYYAGDTGLHADMKLLSELYTVNTAILPIGGHFTMALPHALVAADWIGVDRIIGMHYDTFPPIKIDHEASKNLANSQGKELILMQIGASIKL